MEILRIRDADGNWQEVPALIGPAGEQGPAGATPVKGVDYWTEEDKTEIVSDVLAALPQAEEVSV